MKIIDSDRDAAASLDRLTVLVERLKAQNAELQVMLTKCEEQRDRAPASPAEALEALAAANVEIERMTRAANSARKDADAVRAEALRNADEDTNAWARAKLAEAAHAATKAKLGRAVAALRLAQAFMVEHGPQSVTAAHTAVADVLADADGTQAAEAWRELEAVYEAAKDVARLTSSADEVTNYWIDLRGALAAVDARRGVKP